MKNIVFILIILLFAAELSAQKSQTKKFGKQEEIKVEYQALDSDSIYRGKFKLFFDNILLRDGSYNNGEKDGHWKFYNYEGVLIFEGNYKNGLRSGRWTFYKENKVNYEIYFKNETRDSTWIKRYDDGNVEFIVKYVNGKKHGESKLYYRNHNIKQECKYNHGQLSGSFFKYYDNGKVMEETSFSNGKPNGTSHVYFRNGKLFQELMFEDGKLMELTIQQDINGKPLSKSHVKEGKGYFVSFYLPEDDKEEMIISTECSIKNGTRDGKYTSYFKNGNKKRKGIYSLGIETGKWKYYNKQGKVISKPKFGETGKEISIRGFYDEEIPSTIIGSYFSILDREPEFPGGEDKLNSFIANNVNYPDKYSIMGIGGQVLISFTINETGELINPKIDKSINEDLDQEAMKVIKLMPPWTPGYKDGLPIKVLYQVPINFETQF